MFYLLDLPSQAVAVQSLLRGKSPEEKIEWLVQHGTITKKPNVLNDPHQTYVFESSLGLTCVFFIVGDEFVFLGDNTTFRVRD